MSVRAKVLNVPWLASLRLKDLAHSLMMRMRSGNLWSTIERWSSTVDLNRAPPLPTAMSQGMPGMMTVDIRWQDETCKTCKPLWTGVCH